MKKTILLFSTLLFSVATLYAQATEKRNTNFHAGGLTNEDFFTQSDLVVESSFLGIVATYDTKGNRNSNDIYSIAAIKVHKVYKGDKSLERDTVYIVGKGGLHDIAKLFWLDDIANIEEGEFAVEPEHGILYAIPSIIDHYECGNCNWHDDVPHIFFFRISDFPDIENSKYSSYKKYKYLYSSETRLYVCGDKILGLDNLVFQNRREFYDYIKQFEGFIVPKSTSLPEKQIEKTVPKEML